MLCVPLLCFNVSADDSSSYDYSYLYGTSFTSFKSSYAISELKKVSDGPFLNGSYETGKPNLRKSDYWKEDTNGLKTNYIGWVEPNTEDYYVMDNTINNVLLLALAKSRYGYGVDRTQPIYYYCYCYVYKGSDIQIHKNYEFYFSNSPLTFRSCTNSYCDYVKLNSIDSCHVSVFTFLDELDGVSYPNAYAGSGLAINSTAVCGTQITSGNEICFKSGDYGQVMIEEQYVNSSREFQFKCNLNCYSFISSFSNYDIDSSCFSSGTVDNVSDIASDKSFKDFIDVKLTPEFTIGMDRSIPDSTFGISEDYWSLEVTNNNDFNIQFKCYVIPATGAVNYVSEWSHDESLKSYSSGIPVLVNTDDFIPVVPDETVWMLEKDQWIYSKETENQEDYFKDTPYLVNKPTSNFFVQAGGTFKQVIKWNQLNLNKNQPYQILVTACECPYDRASDIHISLASDDYSQSFKHIIEESYFIVFDDTFSVTNPLYYDSTDTFGGVIANTGSSQVNTDYWKINAIEKDGEIEIRNADYSNGWRLNPDGGVVSGTLKEGLFNKLDDISLSDVTKLVHDTGSYLTLVATVFKFFPSWIWILLFAGISGLLVIGVFKMLH